jgi:dCMP deaminase
VKPKFIEAFMDCAERFAQLSTATRAKVGAIIVKDNRIISIGYNGMPSGWTNECEHKEYMPTDAGGWLDAEDILEQWPYTEEVEVGDGGHRYRMKSNPEVLHAETNAIAKVARSPESAEDATLFCTHLPCMDCAKLIYQSGIAEVYYRVEYDASRGNGKEFLTNSNIKLTKVD